ncbi:HEAT repeat domain-containing protein [Actinoplanes bogorensis]|uniref:HEAT repeat domain-containing protein n=1 Tax=Paractinoplanes bogorensis TaxID=1610840 RepID=A0ABS5Z5R6_9ACTN|nr:HEAT repeat domain-containing protein [Actinoplanes bogorensis]MBU2671048.1 HEAT repeat domain-containing protein [Actinoplanes bogorensis]
MDSRIDRPIPARMPTADLFTAARDEVVADDPEAPVPFLVALHDRPTREVFDTAAELLRSDDSTDRELAARVLRELGPQDDAGDRPFTSEAVPLLRARLSTEPEPQVLRWLISALAYNSATDALDDVVPFANHADGRVRFHVAASLTSLMNRTHPEPAALDALQSLCRDDNPDTRFYALYALAEELDGLPASRLDPTLAALATDPDPQIRELAQSHQG